MGFPLLGGGLSRSVMRWQTRWRTSRCLCMICRRRIARATDWLTVTVTVTEAGNAVREVTTGRY